MLEGLPVLERALSSQAAIVASGFTWAGTFVFDGGPGALPLLHDTVVDPWLGERYAVPDRVRSGGGHAGATPDLQWISGGW